jgi:hypothetical protein
MLEDAAHDSETRQEGGAPDEDASGRIDWVPRAASWVSRRPPFLETYEVDGCEQRL